MTDEITAVYYTANRINDRFALPIRDHLLSHALPIVSVSHKPIDLGDNICIGETEASPYVLYKQILLGAQAAKTHYVACCEDDTLYPPDHFMMSPPLDDTFYYNANRWWIESSGAYRFRDRAAMCSCVVARELLIETLEARFAKWPTHPPGRDAWRIFGEPGRVEKRLGLPPVKMERHRTMQAVVTFNHRDSLGGKRRAEQQDRWAEELPYWGNAALLWERFHG